MCEGVWNAKTKKQDIVKIKDQTMHQNFSYMSAVKKKTYHDSKATDSAPCKCIKSLLEKFQNVKKTTRGIKSCSVIFWSLGSSRPFFFVHFHFPENSAFASLGKNCLPSILDRSKTPPKLDGTLNGYKIRHRSFGGPLFRLQIWRTISILKKISSKFFGWLNYAKKKIAFDAVFY